MKSDSPVTKTIVTFYQVLCMYSVSVSVFLTQNDRRIGGSCKECCLLLWYCTCIDMLLQTYMKENDTLEQGRPRDFISC